MTAVLWAAPLAALALAFAGMAGLALAMDRHHEQVTGRAEVVPHTRRRVLRWVGSLLLALSLAACIGAWGATVGVTAWCGFLTAGGLLVGVLLTYAPRLAPRVSAATVLVAGLSCLAWAAGGP